MKTIQVKHYCTAFRLVFVVYLCLLFITVHYKPTELITSFKLIVGSNKIKLLVLGTAYTYYCLSDNLAAGKCTITKLY